LSSNVRSQPERQGVVQFNAFGGHIATVTDDFNACRQGRLEALGVMGINISGDGDFAAVRALYQEEEHRARASGGHPGEFIEVLGAARRDGIRELGKAASAAHGDGLDLDVTRRQAVAFQKQVDAAGFAVADFAS
jgi:hypothetical protein